MPNSISTLNWYKLDPIDLLLMREAKPFSPGDGSWAKGQFPPLPITVFQAMRSATPWKGRDNNRQRDLEFVGPFLLHAPPDRDPSLWLPTPQDLLRVKTFSTAEEETNESDRTASIEETNLTDVSSEWERTARFQPLERTNSTWEFLGFDPAFFPEGELVPMVPPTQTAHLDSEAATGDLNACLRSIDESHREGIAGRPLPWIRADALVQYLEGAVLEKETSKEQTQVQQNSPPEDCFHQDPWTTQVLPHIKIQSGARQVEEEDGYFTEVSIRMDTHWHLVAGISATLDSKVVRLGGEGHRALVSLIPSPPGWEALRAFLLPNAASQTAYVLTPGLAQVAEERFGLIPETWKPSLRGCVGDRALLWGGMSVFQKPDSPEKSVAFQPQRAFVPPGTVYRFQPGALPDEIEALATTDSAPPKLLPAEGGSWLATFNSLNYGLLLWGQ